MGEYTEALHARRLIQMLKQPEPCKCCPARSRWKLDMPSIRFIKEARLDKADPEHLDYRIVCEICRNFLGLTKTYKCPCGILGPVEALERTIATLKEKGYLK